MYRTVAIILWPFSKCLEDGQLERIDIVPTGGKFPRHFALTPCGKAVIVANQDSSNLTLFSRDIETGLIQATGQTYDLPAQIIFVLS